MLSARVEGKAARRGFLCLKARHGLCRSSAGAFYHTALRRWFALFSATEVPFCVFLRLFGVLDLLYFFCEILKGKILLYSNYAIIFLKLFNVILKFL